MVEMIISDDEKKLLLKFEDRLQFNLHGKLRSLGSSTVLCLTSDQATVLGDWLGDLLGPIGFDKRNIPTQEGLIIESLLDKLADA